MESRADLIPPCCAACYKAGAADVTWTPKPRRRAKGEWVVIHSGIKRKVAHGAEALVMLQQLHYANPPVGVPATGPVTASVPVTVHLANNPQAPIRAEDIHG